MAIYQNGKELTHLVNSRFDVKHKPGQIVPYSGIYMCTNCGDEAACNHGDPFPPQNHRQHKQGQGDILWQLLVQTQKGPD